MFSLHLAKFSELSEFCDAGVTWGEVFSANVLDLKSKNGVYRNFFNLPE